MKTLNRKIGFYLCFIVFFLTGCNEDPVSDLNRLTSEYGFIGYQNALENSSPGTLIAGKPTSVAFVAPANDCFPEEQIPRYTDTSDFNRTYEYTYKGSLGFLTLGTPLISAGAGLEKSHYVLIELSGITIEYMSSIDVTEWYREGMRDVCKEYLNEVGFIIQSISANKLKISIKKSSGSTLHLNTENVSQYFNFDAGVDWSVNDSYEVEIDSPKYIGYQLGRLRFADEGMTLYRAMSTKDDKYLFEPISVFESIEEVSKKFVPSALDDNAIYMD